MIRKVKAAEDADFLKKIPRKIKEYLFKPNIISAKGRLGEYGVIVNLNTGRYYTVNLTGEKIWQYLNGKRTVNAIIGMTAKRFSVPKGRIAGDVISIMRTLESAGLIRWRVEN